MRSHPVALSWRIRERPGMTTVEFTGDIDETSDFAELVGRLRGTVLFRMSEIRRINSSGVREWVDFVSGLGDVEELIFSHCSPSVVSQINMIYNFAGDANIRSFYAPYACDACQREESKLIDVRSTYPDGVTNKLPDFACEECGGELEFDELPDRYLAFLTGANRP